MSKDIIIQKVYDMLMSQTFVDWCESDFMDYVEGEEECKTKKEIKEDIERMLHL